LLAATSAHSPREIVLADTALLAAKKRRQWRSSTAPGADMEQITGGVAAWSIVDGIATLWFNGDLPSPAQPGDDPEETPRWSSHLRRGLAVTDGT
jgi:hypothetical protein